MCIRDSVSSNDSELEQVLVFVMHKGEVEEFRPIVNQVRGAINAQFGIEVHHVIPIRKVPKTTSGKVQRSSLGDSFVVGEYDDLIKQLSPKINAQPEENDANEIVTQIKKVCAEALPDKTFTVDDSLLELGASSLALVEIHSGLDEMFPGKIEITDLVDHSTISQLAVFLKNKE